MAENEVMICANCGEEIYEGIKSAKGRWFHRSSPGQPNCKPTIATPAATNSSVPAAAPAQSEPELKPPLPWILESVKATLRQTEIMRRVTDAPTRELLCELLKQFDEIATREITELFEGCQENEVA